MTDRKLEHLRKVASGSIVMTLGKCISCKLLHPSKAEAPIVIESFGKVTDERFMQS